MQDQLYHLPDHERAAELIAKHLQDTLTETEQKELDNWIDQEPWRAGYFERAIQADHLHDLLTTYQEAATLETALRAVILERIGNVSAAPAPATAPMHRVHFIKKQWFRVAAAVIFLLGTGGYFFYVSVPRRQGADVAGLTPAPIPAGRQGAILTLEDGSQVTLDSLRDGVVAKQPGGEVRVAGGQLRYQPVGGQAAGAVAYNTVMTPKGRQYQFQLPDGTKVWLNAASRISFPTVFDGAERKVTVTGEAFFEVTRSVRQPFMVAAGGTTVEVLGTSFNVSAYADEGNVKTTLIDGSVRVVHNGSASVVLKPGQQAVGGAGVSVERAVDVEQVIAWKKGLFFFTHTDIHAVMQQLSRWYDIDVQYEGKAPNINVSGKMDKGVNLDEILEFLTKMDVKYKLTGRTVVISDK